MLDFMYQVLPAIERALNIDLPDVVVPRKHRSGGEILNQRRPIRAELNIFVFPQVWPTPALGFEGGAITGDFKDHSTAAYTTVIMHECGVAAVYFGGSFAYLAPLSSDLWDDVRRHEMRPVSRKKFYGRVTPNGEEIPDAVQDGHGESKS